VLVLALLPSLVSAAAMSVALGIDRRWGEPAARVHPVVGMGRLLSWAGPRLWGRAAWSARLGGALAWWLGAALCVALAFLLQHGVMRAVHQGVDLLRLAMGTPRAGQGGVEGAWMLTELAAQALLLGALLKPLLAWRMLRDEVGAVEAALQSSLPAGRERLAWLVSRDVQVLDEGQVRESAIETLAENLNDSVVAPLCWFALAGLPGAALYRWANTADAMWGYRDHRRWMGAWAARADDVLSWVPARLTAGGLCLAAWRWPGPGPLRREARRTPSPNGGWPMGAMALLLGVRLGKPGAYCLNSGAPVPAREATVLALRWSGRAVWWVLGMLVLLRAAPVLVGGLGAGLSTGAGG
jgi:adenosylcobinamide-phosphate synthase